MGDGEREQLGMAHDRRPPQAAQRGRRPLPVRRQSRQSAGIHLRSPATARPRRARPEESPCRLRSTGVSQTSLNTWRGSSGGHALRRGASMLDSPPPSTITSGSSMLTIMREAARQPVGVALQRRLRPRIAGRGAGRDARWRRARPARRSRAPAPGPETQVSRQPCWPHQQRGPGSSSRRAARAGGCGPTRRRSGCGPSSTRPSTTMPPPQPVPRMTPNTDAGCPPRRRPPPR